MNRWELRNILRMGIVGSLNWNDGWDARMGIVGILRMGGWQLSGIPL